MLKFLLIAITGLIFFNTSASICRDSENAFAIPNLHRPPAEKSEAEVFERFILESAPSDEAFIAVQRLASRHIIKKDWQKAEEVFKKYKCFFPEDSTKFNKIIDLINQPCDSLIITNLGNGVNSLGDELNPKPTADEKKLYFTGGGRSDNKGVDDIFISKKENGTWQKAINHGSLLNTGKSEAITGISADGTRMLLFGNYRKSMGRGDIFKINKTINGWSRIEHFPPPINSGFFECDATYSGDGKAILFISDRPGSVGGYHKKDEPYHGDVWGNTDIFVTLKTDTGWSEPVNLGDVINTPYAERSPFLHPDGKTLYFSSDGHYGLGYLDVFKADRLSDTSWTEWSEPVNLGKKINTAGDDWGYNFTTKGDIAYFTSDKLEAGKGGLDIYSITIPERARPDQIATISGKVTDEHGNPLDAAIRWEDISQREKKDIGELYSDPMNGEYYIILPLEKNYEYYAFKKGYFPTTKSLDLRHFDKENRDTSIEVTENIVLESIIGLAKRGVKKYIMNIFDTNQYDFNPAAYTSINMLVDILIENPNIRVEVFAHTDSRGSEEYNNRLSEMRAQTMRTHLLENGISEERIIAKGYGEQFPVVPNNSLENMAKNRRLEFRFHTE